jgi:hypothetical protein
MGVLFVSHGWKIQLNPPYPQYNKLDPLPRRPAPLEDRINCYDAIALPTLSTYLC